jgi:hypothetical protein
MNHCKNTNFAVGWQNLVSYVMAAFMLLLSNHALSQAAVGVVPPSQLVTAQPGEQIDGVITINNPNDTPITVRIYLADWNYNAEETQTFYEPGSLSASASPWITFSPSILTLEGQESTEVRYTAEVPINASPGTHWSMLFVEGENPNPAPGDRLATFKVRVGHTIYVNVPPLERDGMITGIFGVPPDDANTPYRFAIQYANTGNAAYAVEGVMELRDISGETVATIDVDRLVVLPHSMRFITSNLFGPLDPGPYTMLIILNYGDRTKDIAGDYTFVLEKPLEVLAPPDFDEVEAEGNP